MKNKEMFVLLIVAGVGLLLLGLSTGWMFGRQYSRLELTQQSTSASLTDLHSRFLLVENDYHRRTRIWAKVKAAGVWVCHRLGL